MANIELSKEQKKQAILDIKEYFANERDEDLGDLGSEMILDFILEKMGPYFYNQAVIDMQKFLTEKVEDMYGLMI